MPASRVRTPAGLDRQIEDAAHGAEIARLRPELFGECHQMRWSN